MKKNLSFLGFLGAFLSLFVAISRADTFIARPALHEGITGVTVNGGTLALTYIAENVLHLTGTTTETVTLPDATGLKVGRYVTVRNDSTGAATFKLFDGSTTLTTVRPARSAKLELKSNATSNGTWIVFDEDYVKTTGDTMSGALVNASGFVGPLTGAASLNVLKTGDSMSGTLVGPTVLVGDPSGATGPFQVQKSIAGNLFSTFYNPSTSSSAQSSVVAQTDSYSTSLLSYSSTAAGSLFPGVTTSDPKGLRLNNSLASSTVKLATGAVDRLTVNNSTLAISGGISQVWSGSSSGTFTQSVPATISSYAVTWPSTQGASADCLKNDGSGGMSWGTCTGAGTFVLKTGDSMSGQLQMFAGNSSTPAISLGGSGTGLSKYPFGQGVVISVSSANLFQISRSGGGGAFIELSGATVNVIGSQSSASLNHYGAFGEDEGLRVYGPTHASKPGSVDIFTGFSARIAIASAGAITMNGNVSMGGAKDIALSTAQVANRALVSDASRNITSSAVTDTELSYLSGLTASVSSLLGAKVSKTGDTMSGDLVSSGFASVLLTDGVYGVHTSNGSDNKAAILSGSNIQSGGRGANLAVFGNQSAVNAGGADLFLGDDAEAPSAEFRVFSDSISSTVPTFSVNQAGQIKNSTLTANQVLVSGASGLITFVATTATEVQTLSGATGNIQSQLNTHTGQIAAIQVATASLQNSKVAKAGDTMTGDLSMNSDMVFVNPSGNKIRHNSANGSDDRQLYLAGGGDYLTTRGSTVGVFGNQFGDPTLAGAIALYLGNSSETPDATVAVYSGGSPVFKVGHGGSINTTLTASRALVTDSLKNVTASVVTSTELGYLSGLTTALAPNLNGLTSNVQTQLNAKAATTYVDSQDALKVTKAGDTMTGSLQSAVGSVSAPGFAVGAADTGFYRSAAGRIALTANGARIGDFRPFGTGMQFAMGATSDGNIINSGDTSSFIRLAGGASTTDGAAVIVHGSTHATRAGDLSIETAGTERLKITSTGAISSPSSVTLSAGPLSLTGQETITFDGTSGSGNLTLQASTSTKGAALTLNNGGAGVANIAIEGATSGVFMTGTTANSLIVATTSTRNLQFGTNNTIRETIDTSGNHSFSGNITTPADVVMNGGVGNDLLITQGGRIIVNQGAGGNGGMRAGDGGTPPVLIDAGGVVGITVPYGGGQVSFPNGLIAVNTITTKASSTGTASLNIPAGTAPTSPNSGDVWHDSARNAIRAHVGSVGQSLMGTLFTSTATTTLTGTTTETTTIGSGVGTLTFPANFFTAGKSFVWESYCLLSADAAAPGNLNIRVKIDGTTALSGNRAIPLSLAADSMFTHRVMCTQRTAGAGGQMVCEGFSMLNTTVTSSPQRWALGSTSAFTNDTTAAAAFDLTAQFDSNDGDNNLRCYLGKLEILN